MNSVGSLARKVALLQTAGGEAGHRYELKWGRPGTPALVAQLTAHGDIGWLAVRRSAWPSCRACLCRFSSHASED